MNPNKIPIIGLGFTILLILLLQFYFFTNNEFNEVDYWTYFYPASLFLSGKNPYIIYYKMNHYPPGFFYLYSGIILIVGDQLNDFIISTYFFYWLTFFSLTYITLRTFNINNKKHKNNKEKAINISNKNLQNDNVKRNEINGINCKSKTQVNKTNKLNNMGAINRNTLLVSIILILFLIDPSINIRTLVGSNDIFISLPILWGFYFFIKNKHGYASFIWAVAISIKLGPLFFYPLLFFYFWKRYDFFRLIQYFLTAFFVYVFFLIPFLVMDFGGTIYGIFSISSKVSYEYSFFVHYPDINAFFYRIIFSWEGLEISLWFTIQIFCYFVILILILYKQDGKLLFKRLFSPFGMLLKENDNILKNKKSENFNKKISGKIVIGNNKHQFIMGSFIIIILLSILTNNYGIRYMAWIAPTFYFYLLYKKPPMYKVSIFLFFTRGLLGPIIWSLNPINIYLFLFLTYSITFALVYSIFKGFDND